jgi:fructose-1-phosphate kinase PfkB-like protein
VAAIGASETSPIQTVCGPRSIRTEPMRPSVGAGDTMTGCGVTITVPAVPDAGLLSVGCVAGTAAALSSNNSLRRTNERMYTARSATAV